jgi:hypothetical protein
MMKSDLINYFSDDLQVLNTLYINIVGFNDKITVRN